MSAADEAAHAYRLGLMGPRTRAEYEDAVQAGIVTDTYAATRLQNRSGGGDVMGSAMTLERAIPFLSEGGAGLAAGLSTAGDLAHGRSPDIAARFKQARDQQQGMVDEFKGRHPALANVSTGGGYALQAVPALLTGGATAGPSIEAAASPLLTRLATGTAKNGLIGGMYGYLNGLSQPGALGQRLKQAASDAPAGMAAGVIAPAAFSGAKAFATKAVPFVARRAGAVLSEIADAGARYLTGKLPAEQAAVISPEAARRGRVAALDTLKQLGATPEGLRQAAIDAGTAPITTVEAIGPAAITHATGISRRSGTTPALADAAMSARAASRPKRVLDLLTEHTGIDPEAAKGDIQALVQHGQTMATPAFDAVRAIPGPIWTPELAAWAETPVGKKTISATIESARNVPGANPAEMGFPIDPDTGAVMTGPELSDLQPQPTAKTWDAIRQRMSQMVDRDTFGRAIPDSQSPGNYDINQSRRYLTDVLAGDGTKPGLLTGYRDALDQSGDYQSIDRAFNNAKGKLLGKSADANAADFAKWFAGLKPIEQTAAKASGANDMLVALQGGSLRPGTFALPHVQLKLQTLFGDEAAQKLTAAMDQEAKMAAAEARLKPNLNSVTPDLMGSNADQVDAAGSAALDAAGHLLTGKPVRAARSLAGGLSPYLSAARKPLDQAARNALGDLFYADPADVAHLLEAHNLSSVGDFRMPRLPRISPAVAPLLTLAGGDQPN